MYRSIAARPAHHRQDRPHRRTRHVRVLDRRPVRRLGADVDGRGARSLPGLRLGDVARGLDDRQRIQAWASSQSRQPFSRSRLSSRGCPVVLAPARLQESGNSGAGQQNVVGRGSAGPHDFVVPAIGRAHVVHPFENAVAVSREPKPVLRSAQLRLTCGRYFCAAAPETRYRSRAAGGFARSPCSNLGGRSQLFTAIR
jgi:hypothetical protein